MEDFHRNIRALYHAFETEGKPFQMISCNEYSIFTSPANGDERGKFNVNRFESHITIMGDLPDNGIIICQFYDEDMRREVNTLIEKYTVGTMISSALIVELFGYEPSNWRNN